MQFVSFKNWSLHAKVVIPVVALGVMLTLGMFQLVGATQRQLVLSQAERSAQYVGNQIQADRQFYTDSVIRKLRDDGIDLKAVTLAELGRTKGTIALPATFVHGTSKIVNDKGLHKADLLSLWNLNPEKGPRTVQERRALEQLVRDPQASVSWSVDDDLPSARFYRVTADIASSQACVTCHNDNPQSQRHDFRLNDTMGALVVSLPLATDFAAARENTWLWTGTIGSVFAVLIVVVLYVQLNYVTRPIQHLQDVAERISRGEVDTPVQVRTGDEIGRLGSAFDRMRMSVKIAIDRLKKK